MSHYVGNLANWSNGVFAETSGVGNENENRFFLQLVEMQAGATSKMLESHFLPCGQTHKREDGAQSGRLDLQLTSWAELPMSSLLGLRGICVSLNKYSIWLD